MKILTVHVKDLNLNLWAVPFYEDCLAKVRVSDSGTGNNKSGGFSE
jgi:hypothetical protein